MRKCAELTFHNLPSLSWGCAWLNFSRIWQSVEQHSWALFPTCHHAEWRAHYILLVSLEHLTGPAEISGGSWILPTGNLHRHLSFGAVYDANPQLNPALQPLLWAPRRPQRSRQMSARQIQPVRRTRQLASHLKTAPQMDLWQRCSFLFCHKLTFYK